VALCRSRLSLRTETISESSFTLRVLYL
jgi:hypothetical protein